MVIRMTWPDYLRSQVHYNGEYVKLTVTEMAIVLPLLLRRGHIIPRPDLIEMIWPDPDQQPLSADNVIGVMQVRLRKKLPGLIENVWGRGLVIR